MLWCGVMSPRVVDGGASRGNDHCSLTGLTGEIRRLTKINQQILLTSYVLAMHYVIDVFLPSLSVLPNFLYQDSYKCKV